MRWRGNGGFAAVLAASVLTGFLIGSGELLLGPSLGTSAGTPPSEVPQVGEPTGTVDRGGAGRPSETPVLDSAPVLSVDVGPLPTPATRPIRIAFGGDVNAAGPIGAGLLAGEPLLDDLAAVLGTVDLAVVNLETAVGQRGAPADKQHTFQAPVELVRALAAAGVDVVSLANNHALDYGVEALLETIEQADAAGLQVVGAGRDAAAAYAPVVVDVRGTTVAIVGLTRVIPEPGWAATRYAAGMASAYDEEAAVAAVRAAADLADRVVVMIHWGVEVTACPADHQHRLARLLVEAGADVVAGHHPHVLQGLEDIDGAVVAHSLGNLVFPAWHEETRRSGVLVVELDDDGVRAELTPMRIDDRGSPRLLEGGEAAEVRARVEALRPGAGTC